jgi:hypothetical protein
MKMAIVPRYADIFDEPVLELDDLLKDISSEAIIGLLTMIQAKLHLDSADFKVQAEILQLFLRRQSLATQHRIGLKLMESRKDRGADAYAIFSELHTLEFMHYSLGHYQEIPMGDDTTPDQEYRLFKAYIIFIEKRQQIDEGIFDENRHHTVDFFYKNTWPLLSSQYEAGHIINPFTEMIRGIVLFNFLEFNSPYAESIRQFLAKRGHTNSWNYVFALLNVIQHSWKQSERNQDKSSSAIISVTEEFKPLFDSISMDVQNYAATYAADHRNYSGIKDKPIFRYGENSYFILNWNFLHNKLYEGLLFDLYTHSDISSAGGFKTFPNFKQYVSEEVTEGILFKKLLRASLQKKHSVLLFDEKTTPGFPDAYYRDVGDVILFEIKDAFFPANAINTTSFQAIKDAIDAKYNQDNKGTGQLISQLQHILNTPFEKIKGYKHSRNLTIYPVMIYTDHFFSMPGVNQYLQEAFVEKITKAGLMTKFKKIQPLVFVNIRFLINHLDLLRKNGTGFIDLFKLYYNEQARTQKKVRRTVDLNAYFDCYQTFEMAVKYKYGDVMYRQEGYVKTVVDTLELTQGMPAGLEEDK